MFAFLSQRVTLFAECRRNGGGGGKVFHDTPIYFHRAGVTQKGVYHTAIVNVEATKGCWFSLTAVATPSKFIICRRASSCRVVQGMRCVAA
jgi:hypothetical protein